MALARPLSPGVATALVAGAASLWGLWSLILRPTGLPATTTGPLLFAFMTAWTMPLALRGAPVVWRRRTVALLVGNTLFDAANVLCFFAAMTHTTVAIAVVTHYAAPILVALLAPRIDRVRVPGAPIAATVAMLGLALVLEPWRSGGAWLLGGALGLGSAVMYAGNVFCTSRLTLAIGATRAMAYHSGLAALLLAPLALPGLGAIDGDAWGRMAIGTAVLGALAGVAYLRGLVVIGATRAAMLTFCEPLVAVAVGALAFGEVVRPLAAVGIALVLGAGAWVVRRPQPSSPAE